MIDPDLKKQLDDINVNLKQIKKNTGGLWYSFLIGTMRGLGSIIGVAIALLLIGYVLDMLGIIPAFREQVNSWHQTLDNLSKIR